MMSICFDILHMNNALKHVRQFV